MYIVFMMTNKCTAACAHCCMHASPKNNDVLSVRTMCHVIDEAARIAHHQKDFFVCFTGGEPFLFLDSLITTTRYAKEKGARVACVTNGFWATSRQRTENILGTMKDAGLATLAVSCDVFHEARIPVRHITEIFNASVKKNIGLQIKCTVFKNSKRVHDILPILGNSSLGITFQIQDIPCLPEGRAATLPSDIFLYAHSLPSLPCPVRGTYMIAWDGTVFPCCTMQMQSSLMRIGNIHTTSFSTLYKKMKHTTFFEILQEKGPVYFVPFLKKAGFSFPNNGFVNECDVCQHICKYADEDSAANQAVDTALSIWENEQEQYNKACTTLDALLEDTHRKR